MPDVSINWRALKEHWRKYKWIYAVGIAVCLVVASLLWSTTAPQLTNEQVVLAYMVDEVSYAEPLEDVAEKMLEAGKLVDERLESVEFQSLQFSDPSQDMNSGMLLVTRLSTGDVDFFLASQTGMDALVTYRALQPLDELLDEGWLSQYGLEPYPVKVYGPEDLDEAGEPLPEAEGETYIAGLRIDKVSALLTRRAFSNEGAFLALSATSQNPEATRRAVEVMLDVLMAESAEGAQAQNASAEAVEGAQAQDASAEAAEGADDAAQNASAEAVEGAQAQDASAEAAEGAGDAAQDASPEAGESEAGADGGDGNGSAGPSA